MKQLSMNDKRKIVLICLLSLLYSYVFYLVITPDVDEYYRAYYITDETDVTIRMSREFRFQPITLGEIEDYRSNRVLFDSWWDAEADRRWSKGKQSRIRFALDGDDLSRLKGNITIRFWPPPKPQRIRFSLNGHPVADRLLLKDGAVELSVSPAFFGRMNNFVMDVSGSRRASATDPRTIGVALRDFTVE